MHVALCNARVVTLLPEGCNNVTGTLACPVGFGCSRVVWHVPLAYRTNVRQSRVTLCCVFGMSLRRVVTT